MAAYYSEFDRNAAAWLRELIKRGLIADGDVDERDLWDVAPADLAGYTQVHLCAGIGVWSYALRRAGWADDRPVWTGSFPCQPFSAAGKGAGFADERHLWPAGYHLIAECRPPVVFGEQVASKDAEPWLDLVQNDLENMDYAFGAVAYASALVGAPHIRDRLYWVADATRGGRGEERSNDRGLAAGSGEEGHSAGLGAGRGAGRLADTLGERGGERRQQSEDSGVGGVADADRRQRQGFAVFRGAERDGPDAGWAEGSGGAAPRGEDAGLRGGERGLQDGAGAQGEHGLREVALRPGPVNGLWRTADWLYCRDGSWRSVEPGLEPLAHGAATRVGCVCAACLESTAESADDEDLRVLRKVSGAADGRVPQEVLQPTMPVGTPSPGTGYARSRSMASSASIPEHALRDVWGDGGEPPASSGREPEEQHAREHPDFVPGLPQQGASCERCGATDELYTVTITGTSRVAKLRGYGNAINAEAAQVWIESYLEATGESTVASANAGAEAAV